MGRLTSRIVPGDWNSVAHAIATLDAKLNTDSSPIFLSVGLTGLTENALMYADGDGILVSLAAATSGQLVIGSTGTAPSIAALTGTANQVVVTPGAGSITLSTPQNIHAAATPTFAGLTVDNIGGTNAVITMDGSSNSAGTITYESDNNLFIIDKEVQINGDVGIGVISPSANIEVFSDIMANSYKFKPTNTAIIQAGSGNGIELISDLFTVAGDMIVNPTLLIDNTGGTDAILTMDGSSNDALTLTYESDNALLKISKMVTVDGSLLTLNQNADGPSFGGGVPTTGIRAVGFDDENDKYLNIAIESHGLAVIGGTASTIYFSPNNTLAVFVNANGFGTLNDKGITFGITSLLQSAISQCTHQTGGYSLMLGVNDDVTTPSRAVIICGIDDVHYDFAHPSQTNPILFIQSDNRSATEWISLTHNQTDGVIATGSGDLNLVPATNTTIGDGGITNYTQISAIGDITQVGTGRTHESEKFKLTAIGGFAVKLTNKTGGNTVAGQLVAPYSATAVDDAFKMAAANSDEVFGIVLDAGIADGSEAWVVVSGIADVLMDAGGSARGDRIISSATAGSADVWNVGGAVATHFLEIGHCIETRVGAGLARCILHFN